MKLKEVPEKERRTLPNWQTFKLCDLGISLIESMLLSREDAVDLTVAVISDETVFGIYGDEAVKSLEKMGFKVVTIVTSCGEEAKTPESYIRVLEELAQIPLTRKDVIVALGGGVVGDLAGFVASTYLRGIRLYQVPTSLLAMVDSSVGGKNAINLSRGKNLVGTFYPPSKVFCDVSLLNSLSEEQFEEGLGEIAKYALLGDGPLLDILEEAIAKNLALQGDVLEEIVYLSVKKKLEIVDEDPFDTGYRQVLNLGHTLAHAIEKASNYQVSHGKAVAKGMALMADLSESAGWLTSEQAQKIKTFLRDLGLDVSNSWPLPHLIELAMADKKRQGSSITLVVFEDFGKVQLRTIGIDEFRTLGKMVKVISSKSYGHRALICQAIRRIQRILKDEEDDCKPEIIIHQQSDDMDVTKKACDRLISHCAMMMDKSSKQGKELSEVPLDDVHIDISCGESGSTLRFLMALVGALGLNCSLHMEGRLPKRPIHPLDKELEEHGIVIENKGGSPLRMHGQLEGGIYHLPGNVSSQYVSGLMMALPILEKDSSIEVTKPVESLPYIDITLDVLKSFSVEIKVEDTEDKIIYKIKGGQQYVRNDEYKVEGDWSNGGYWLAMKRLRPEAIEVLGLTLPTKQGDYKAEQLLDSICKDSSEHIGKLSVDCSQIPDSVPLLAVMSALTFGMKTKFYNCSRLRLKESDRIETTLKLIRSLGAKGYLVDDGFVVEGNDELAGGIVDGCNDHRIVMAAAVASLKTKGAVVICGSKAVNKSYPEFFNIMKRLGLAENLVLK